MVTQSVMSTACSEFTQNAWKKDLCKNCQRPRAEHSIVGDFNPESTSSPIPTKRTSIIADDVIHQAKRNASLILSELEGRNEGNADQRKPRTSRSLSVEKEKLQKPLISYSKVTINNVRSILVKNGEIRRKTFDIKFLEREPSVIGEDGGYDNLFLDNEELPLEEDSGEDISFTEEEREFVLQALHNTIWNSDLNNLNGAKNKTIDDDKSYEFEDVKLSSLWKKDRFSTLRDCDKLLSQRFGTFPLRRPLGSKSSLEQMFDRDGKLERSSSDCDLKKIEEEKEGTHYETNFSLFEKRRSRSASEMEGHVVEQGGTQPYMDVNITQFNGQSDEMKNGEEDVFEMDKFDAESLFENFSTEIDFDSSSAGMALVDHLNAILARYSDNVSIKGFDDNEFLPDSDMNDIPDNSEKILESLRIPKGSIKSKELEAKIVSLATDIRKKKRPAPRPPVAPPPQPTSRNSSSLNSDQSSKKTSPSHSHNFSEPNFKMVPIGKSITGNSQEKFLSPKRTGDFHDDLMDNRNKSDNSKGKKGITSFFRSILRRGKDSPENSTEQINEASSPPRVTVPITPVTSSPEKSKEPSPEAKEERKSPQVKAKVLPAVSCRKSRTSIIMSATETSALFNGPQGNKTEETTESESMTSSMIVEENESKSESVPTVKPSIPTRPKPPPNPKRPTVSPQHGTREGRSSSPASERKGSTGGKDRKGSDTESTTGSLERPDKGSLEREITRALSKEDSPKKDTEPQVVRRRAKSPKRVSAPQKPAVPGKTMENKNALFTKELEMRLSKSLDSKVTPPPAGQKGNVAPPAAGQKPNVEMKKSAPHPPTTTVKSEVSVAPSGGQTNQPSAEPKEEKEEPEPVAAEKIELPKAASRKSFLGKLGNKKSRAPPRPSSVKRTKSITESGGELHAKKIDPSDISGPVLITSMTGGSTLNRRNTISVGEDPSMVSGESTSSGSTAEKYDEWPEFSPLGSLENVYEPIIPKEPPPPPPSGPQADGDLIAPLNTALSVPKSPSEGYLEPVTHRSTAANDPAVTQQSTVTTATNNQPTNQQSVMTLSTNEQIVSDEVKVSMETSVHQEVNVDNVQKSSADPDNVQKSSADPEIQSERERILASQPIYEEINGYGKDPAKESQSSVDLQKSVNDSLSKDMHKFMTDSLTVDMSESLISMDFPLASPSQTGMSSGSEPSSQCSTLSRPKPLPRKRSKRESFSLEQPYIAMNRGSVTSALNETQLRDMLNQLTSMNLQTLRDIYTQYERIFIKEPVSLGVPTAGPLKWTDFDIYGKPVHSSERCVVYNAKLRLSSTNCQLMLQHTKPDLMSSQHPTLLKPTIIFCDHIPYSYLTEDFIKTNQLLLNLHTNQSNSAKCFVAVGQFDISDSLSSHMTSIRHGNSQVMWTVEDMMEHVLFFMLQILSAISHCLDQGFSLGDANFRDVFIITSSNCSHGNIVAFLPHQRSLDGSHIDSVFCFLDKYLAENMSSRSEYEFGKFVGGVLKVQKMLQCRKIEILPLIRSYVEFLLWGPSETSWQGGVERTSSLEPKLSMWLEKERAAMVHRFARESPAEEKKYSITEFYRMKFLLKSSAVSLSECVRTHMSY
ncbi:uncharacterized protein LOC133199246 [Saccostrea echinata]|uniref:uncharacterized protein LOC133199246 n=1 Tax=Saccostrea echinata TaxID=191078 RepID=UPI002A829E47|nr:uncharacterized protein LOC133199246 [Saccostrea echinata]